MGRTSLPPGFRFQPTDVELIMYHLKRKVLRKKFRIEAIAEVNIYDFAPSDLQDKSCLKSRDLVWYFFCPISKKYATGNRVKRATENGYWKTTGKDKPIKSNDKTVGYRKTLIFHLGHAPQGVKTNWVIHEYRIHDDQLPAGGHKDPYVLCKVFEKKGSGPQNGAQYGAFNEEDWIDDDEDENDDKAAAMATDASVQTAPILTERQTSPSVRSLYFPGSTSGFPSAEGPLPSVGCLSSEVLVGETDDDITCLLDTLRDEEGITMDELIGEGNNPLCFPTGNERENNFSLLPVGNGISNGLGDLDSGLPTDEGMFNFSGVLQYDYSQDNIFLQDNLEYIELNDFRAPLDCSNEVVETDNSPVTNMNESNNHENVEHFHSGDGFIGMDQHTSFANQLPALPGESYEVDNYRWFQMNNQFHDGSGNSNVLDLIHEQPDNGVEFTQDMGIGRCADNR